VTIGQNNTAVGRLALRNTVNASDNTAVGLGALYQNVGNSKNSAFGAYAMFYANDASPGALTHNTAVGFEALMGSATASANTGTNNTVVGSQAMRVNTTGTQNTAVGRIAMTNNDAGSYNTAIGMQALQTNTSGGFNVALGLLALGGNTTGSNNVGVGNSALSSNTDGAGSTAVGHQALSAVTTGGTQNTALGYQAGNNITTGDLNIIIGYGVAAPSATGSNQLNIGNTIYGDLAAATVGIGQSAPDQGKLEVKGGSVCVDTNSDNNASSCIANESDARLKRNIAGLAYGLDTLMRLRPVSFEWRHDDPDVLKHYDLVSRFADRPHSIGLIAQEVQAVVPEAIGAETVGDDEVQYLQLDYDKLVPVLIKAVQELKAENDGLQARLEALEAR
jgi:hypothetical protein